VYIYRYCVTQISTSVLLITAIVARTYGAITLRAALLVAVSQVTLVMVTIVQVIRMHNVYVCS